MARLQPRGIGILDPLKGRRMHNAFDAWVLLHPSPPAVDPGRIFALGRVCGQWAAVVCVQFAEPRDTLSPDDHGER